MRIGLDHHSWILFELKQRKKRNKSQNVIIRHLRPVMKTSYRNLERSLSLSSDHASINYWHCCLFNNLVKSIKLGNKHFIWIEFFSITHFYQDVRFKNITQNVEYFSLLIFYKVFRLFWNNAMRRRIEKNQFDQIIIKFIPSLRCYIRLFFQVFDTKILFKSSKKNNINKIAIHFNL